ncbi:MAG TPA: GNAT family N-acetyltransferase [Thermoanaerobaculia bacterium]|nr:GNAT family N-acetyltransferase [Thermoanaerobaculia bacterium]
MNALVPDPFPRLAPRVVLRRLAPADLAPFQAYRADPEVARFQSWSSMSAEEALAFLAERGAAPFGRPGWFQIGIAERATGRLVGDIGICLHRDESEPAEIGFTLATPWQRQGIGSEAVRETLALLFEHTAVSQVMAITDTRNLPSIRLLERVGFSLSRTIPAFFRGEACNEHVFVIRRPAGESSLARTAATC